MPRGGIMGFKKRGCVAIGSHRDLLFYAAGRVYASRLKARFFKTRRRMVMAPRHRNEPNDKRTWEDPTIYDHPILCMKMSDTC